MNTSNICFSEQNDVNDDDIQLKMDFSAQECEKAFQKIYEKNNKTYWIIKRMIDIVVCSFAVLVLAPFLLLISLAIVIDSKGRPIYKQIRIGRHKKPFMIYKFRSMYTNADEMKKELMDKNEKDGPAFKMKNDPRITKVGKFLRRTSIDELPRLFNILKGDMTIVGPRPPLPEEVSQYNEYQKIRLIVTPGLTCYWQVQPKRDDISFKEWMDMDIDYIINRNFLGDIKLIFRTISSIVKGHGR